MAIFAQIRKAYREGKPLSSEQAQFLWFNRHKLGYEFDKLAKYYQLDGYKLSANKPSFIKPSTSFTAADIELFYRRLQLMLANNRHGIELSLTPAQFIQLKNTIGQLIFFHGNQVLTGAPFFAGGIPHVDFFQWGNLMGVIKYEELLSEKGIEGNFLIHFADMKDRTLLQCIQDYQLHQQQHHQQAVYPQPQQAYPSIDYHTPRPRLILQPGKGYL